MYKLEPKLTLRSKCMVNIPWECADLCDWVWLH